MENGGTFGTSPNSLSQLGQSQAPPQGQQSQQTPSQSLQQSQQPQQSQIQNSPPSHPGPPQASSNNSNDLYHPENSSQRPQNQAEGQAQSGSAGSDARQNPSADPSRPTQANNNNNNININSSSNFGVGQEQGGQRGDGGSHDREQSQSDRNDDRQRGSGQDPSQGGQSVGDRGREGDGGDDQGRNGNGRDHDDGNSRQGANVFDNDRNGNNSDDRSGRHEQSNAEDRNHENSGSIEGRPKAEIIAGSAAGAVLILAVLLFVFWRRRRGASCSDILRCRRHMSSVVLEQGASNGRVITHPSYHDEHHANRGITEPLPMAETSHQGLVAQANLWKSANPPLPSPEEQGAWPLTDSSPTLVSDSPTATSSSSRHLQRDRAQPPRYELSRSNTGFGLVRQKTNGTTSEEEADVVKSSHSPFNTRGVRWSWTNSETSNTARAETPNKRRFVTSFTSRRIPSWISLRPNQQRGKEEKARFGTVQPVPMLKNHAVRPTLAPPAVARKVSATISPVTEMNPQSR